VTATNSGDRAGDEVVQLYFRDREASVTRPVLQLCGFVRVSLAPGERREVTFRVPADLFAFTGVDGRLVLEPGTIELMVGRSAADIVARTPIMVVGPEAVLPRRERFFADASLA
jgi:beta-glucosidase